MMRAQYRTRATRVSHRVEGVKMLRRSDEFIYSSFFW